MNREIEQPTVEQRPQVTAEHLRSLVANLQNKSIEKKFKNDFIVLLSRISANERDFKEKKIITEET